MKNYDFFTWKLFLLGLIGGSLLGLLFLANVKILEDIQGVSMQKDFISFGPIKIQLWLFIVLIPIVGLITGWGIGKIIDSMILNIFGSEGYQKMIRGIGIIGLIIWSTIGAIIGYLIPETTFFKIIGAGVGLFIGFIIGFIRMMNDE